MSSTKFATVIIGAGSSGVATAHYLSQSSASAPIAIVDSEPPLSFTSAQSGNNYRNWWPQPAMTDFTERSIELMEGFAAVVPTTVALTRRGYALVTRRAEIDDLLDQLRLSHKHSARAIRIHTNASSPNYQRSSTVWQQEPDGFDVLSNSALIRQVFPTVTPAARHVLHVRQAGDFNSSAFGQHLLAESKGAGSVLITGGVIGIEHAQDFVLTIQRQQSTTQVRAERLVIAAGPFCSAVANMLGESLPIKNVLQQKIAFADRAQVIDRAQPFTVDLDAMPLRWSDEERRSLMQDAEFKHLLETQASGVHARPEGGAYGGWVKLGWAYNNNPSEPTYDVNSDPNFDPSFPELVLRRASQLFPALAEYASTMPNERRHYGGYYSMTEENWPLIGPLETDDAFVVGALSGFGSMAACAAGELCAKWLSGQTLPSYAQQLSLARYQDNDALNEARRVASLSIL